MTQENFYTGSWERHGRSITAAAIISLIGIGVFYFYFQSFATAIVMGIVHGFQKINKSSNNQAGTLSDSAIAALRITVFFTQYACMFFPSWLLVRRMHTRRYVEYVRLKKISITEILLATLGAVMLMPVSIFFSTFLVESLHIPEKLLRGNDSLFTSYTPVEFAWLVFGIAVTPAICEELFFRGHVQRTIERTLSVHSIWIVGVVFGLFHFQPIGLASLSLLGLYFGYLYYRSKSLYPSMAAHFTNNTLALLFSYKPFAENQDWIASATSSEFGLAAIGSLPFAAGTIFLFHKRTRRHEEDYATIKNDDFSPEKIYGDDSSLEFVQPPSTLELQTVSITPNVLKQMRNRKDKISNRHWKRVRMRRNR